jgi:hypothetical protein
MQNIVDYLTDYLSIFTRGSYVGGDLNEPVKGFIERGDFKSVLNYYYQDDDKKLLELKLKDDKKEEFKRSQVELVTKMLEKVDSYTKAGISGESKISQLGGSKNGYWPILAVAATLVNGSAAPVVALPATVAAPYNVVSPTAKPSSGLPEASGATLVDRSSAPAPYVNVVVPTAKPSSGLPEAPGAVIFFTKIEQKLKGDRIRFTSDDILNSYSTSTRELSQFFKQYIKNENDRNRIVASLDGMTLTDSKITGMRDAIVASLDGMSF